MQSPASAPSENGIPLTVEQRLALARERKAKREAVREEDDARIELQVLELEEKLEADGKGSAGRDFVVFGTDEGPVALRCGERILWMGFQKAKPDENGNPRHGDIVNFIVPCLLAPSREDFLAMIERRAGLALVCANRLVRLYQAGAVDRAGK